MDPIVAMFPGQGSQYVGMGAELIKNSPISKRTFEEADDVLRESISKLCFSGPESELVKTANTQPCILTTSIAYWRFLEEKGLTCDYFIGHSLGEYSALVASKRLEFADALRLVRLRGSAMQDAVPQGVGSMAAVLRADEQVIQESIQEVQQQLKASSQKNQNEQTTEKTIVEFANFNSPQQIVIAGHKDPVEKVAALLQEKGFKAIVLNVSAPFHSSLMSPAKEKMLEPIQKVSLQPRPTYILPNISAVPTQNYQKSMLLDQIDGPVRWTQTLQKLSDLGVKKYVEVGPGKVLSGLAKRTLPKNVAILQTEKLESILDMLSLG